MDILLQKFAKFSGLFWPYQGNRVYYTSNTSSIWTQILGYDKVIETELWEVGKSTDSKGCMSDWSG